jgi:hypothetical protein
VNSLIGCLHSALAKGIVRHDDVVEAPNVPAAAIDRGGGCVTFAAASVMCLTREQQCHYNPSRHLSKSSSPAIEDWHKTPMNEDIPLYFDLPAVARKRVNAAYDGPLLYHLGITGRHSALLNCSPPTRRLASDFAPFSRLQPSELSDRRTGLRRNHAGFD